MSLQKTDNGIEKSEEDGADVVKYVQFYAILFYIENFFNRFYFENFTVQPIPVYFKKSFVKV